MQLEGISKELKDLSYENLSKLKDEIVVLLEAKAEKRKYIYKHDCYGCSNYHFNKYKYYAKKITQIDESKKMAMHLLDSS